MYNMHAILLHFSRLVLCFCGVLAVDCGKPQPLQNGSITGQSTVYPIVMHLSCDEGFILRGSPKIQCQTNGTWSKTLSYCEGKNSCFVGTFRITS